jgi:hypothetical protein
VFLTQDRMFAGSRVASLSSSGTGVPSLIEVMYLKRRHDILFKCK